MSVYFKLGQPRLFLLSQTAFLEGSLGCVVIVFILHLPVCNDASGDLL